LGLQRSADIAFPDLNISDVLHLALLAVDAIGARVFSISRLDDEAQGRKADQCRKELGNRHYSAPLADFPLTITMWGEARFPPLSVLAYWTVAGEIPGLGLVPMKVRPEIGRRLDNSANLPTSQGLVTAQERVAGKQLDLADFLSYRR